jgi:hypothetical protein
MDIRLIMLAIALSSSSTLAQTDVQVGDQFHYEIDRTSLKFHNPITITGMEVSPAGLFVTVCAKGMPVCDNPVLNPKLDYSLVGSINKQAKFQPDFKLVGTFETQANGSQIAQCRDFSLGNPKECALHRTETQTTDGRIVRYVRYHLTGEPIRDFTYHFVGTDPMWVKVTDNRKPPKSPVTMTRVTP